MQNLSGQIYILIFRTFFFFLLLFGCITFYQCQDINVAKQLQEVKR